MAGIDFNLLGTIARFLPQRRSEGTLDASPPRSGPYREQYSLGVVPTKHLLADEGSYFTATNPTPGTAVAYALQTTFSDTAGLFAIQNKDPAGGRNIFIDALRLILTVAPTATVSMEFAFKLDSGARTPTAGSTTITPQPQNPAAPVNPAGALNLFAFSAAALTLPAVSNATLVGRAHIPTVLGIVGDEYVVSFGGPDSASAISFLTATRAAATPARMVTHAPPLIIPPGYFGLIHMWWLTAATTAPSFEWELTGWAR